MYIWSFQQTTSSCKHSSCAGRVPQRRHQRPSLFHCVLTAYCKIINFGNTCLKLGRSTLIEVTIVMKMRARERALQPNVCYTSIRAWAQSAALIQNKTKDSTMEHACNPSTGGLWDRRTWDACQLAPLAESASFQSSKRACFKTIKVESTGGDTWCWLLASMLTYTHMHVHTLIFACDFPRLAS